MWYTCQYCGRKFEIIGSTKKPISKFVCSIDCSKALLEQYAYSPQAKYQHEHLAEINAKRREARRTMSPDEHSQYRAVMNRYKREWLAAMSPEDLEKYRAKANAYAKKYYADHKLKTVRYCTVCGNIIPTDSTRRIFCSDACMLQKRAERNRKQYDDRKTKKGGQDHEKNH